MTKESHIRLYIPAFLLLLAAFDLFALKIPGAYTQLHFDGEELIAELNSSAHYPLRDETPKYTLAMVRGEPIGTKDGFIFTFKDDKTRPKFSAGRLFYALADLREKYPRAKWKVSSAIDSDGKAMVPLIGVLQGKYDFIDWEGKGEGLLFYRLTDKHGAIIYEGKLYFSHNKSGFHVDSGTICEGPFVNKMTHESVTISFETLKKKRGSVFVKGVGSFKDSTRTSHHEITLTGLSPDEHYDYTIDGGGLHKEQYTFKTVPTPGSREPFTFAFASDSRNGIASGERDIAGVNAYMMRRISALASYKDAVFMQFTGDMIDGYNNAPKMQELEYTNWKRSISPFASHIPYITSMGNHEALLYSFDTTERRGVNIDRFPYATESAEAVFAQAFVNPENGPISEDGAPYDPDPSSIDFPSYKESVFYYIYDNIAMVSLNSNYWYSPTIQRGQFIVGGNPHGYLMDNQLRWLKSSLEKLQSDEKIDHIFITQHTPVFPNGGHVHDDMFYDGNNTIRPYIADADGSLKAHPKGIIERRDEYWRLLMKYDKVIAVLTGDEHNYARLEVSPGMPLYNADQYLPKEKLSITRTIWQIHNGAAGAPYYAKEDAPWNRDVTKGQKADGRYLKNFTTENAVVFFHINGKGVRLEVINPDTLNIVEKVILKELPKTKKELKSQKYSSGDWEMLKK